MRATTPPEVPNASKEIPGSSHTPPYQASSTPHGPVSKTAKAPCISADGTIPAVQLREFILGAIKDNQEENLPSYSYAKPYGSRIDGLRMPQGYQPPKFQQFDGVGNPKQHIAHFIETCNNARTTGDLMVKQLVRSLKGIAFEWYIELESDSIDSWSQLENEFLTRFFSTRRTVSMIELTGTRQRQEEPVADYINRWRSLCLKRKDKLSESSAISMCIQGMQWELQYILQGILPRTFEQLSTRAHDMELTIAANKERGTYTSTSTLYEAKSENEDEDMEEPDKEEVHATTSKSMKFSFKTKRTQGDTNFGSRSCPTLKEL
ncbi:hypothetical protein LIER_23776 [Lithospermum erythrorhizon]|uniref:Retrotransposon gag domain-containing protein n=1 Tax=Lithospermum erythrorhizon TaxID=34254 RepID=A0AAV3R2G1_LITER